MKIAVQVAKAHERSRGWSVENVESENRSYARRSKRPHQISAEAILEAASE